MASFLFMIVDGVSKIVADQGLDDHGGILNEIPPVLPVDLCGMTPRDFAKAPQNQKYCLSHSAVQSFKECWSPLGKDYNALKEYCGGLASVMPGTSSVEADFSLINWTRDPQSKSLTDFSLESILHCKQYRTL